jgi:hypothetical protein
MHPTVRVKVADQEADIDEQIAPLIRLMWERGIDTKFCCQDYGESMDDPSKNGWMYVQFDPENMCKFLDLVQVPTKEMGLPESPINPYPFFIWEWEVYPVWDPKLEHTVLMTMVVFPADTLDWIMWRLQHKQVA